MASLVKPRWLARGDASTRHMRRDLRPFMAIERSDDVTSCRSNVPSTRANGTSATRRDKLRDGSLDDPRDRLSRVNRIPLELQREVFGQVDRHASFLRNDLAL